MPPIAASNKSSPMVFACARKRKIIFRVSAALMSESKKIPRAGCVMASCTQARAKSSWRTLPSGSRGISSRKAATILCLVLTTITWARLGPAPPAISWATFAKLMGPQIFGSSTEGRFSHSARCVGSKVATSNTTSSPSEKPLAAGNEYENVLPLVMIWYRRGMPITFPALRSLRVTRISSMDGVGSPDGWL